MNNYFLIYLINAMHKVNNNICINFKIQRLPFFINLMKSFNCIRYTESNLGSVMKYELKSIQKESSVSYFKHCAEVWLGELEENHAKISFGLPISVSRFEKNFLIRSSGNFWLFHSFYFYKNNEKFCVQIYNRCPPPRCKVSLNMWSFSADRVSSRAATC
jgi:hypothetical protein